MRIWEGFVGVWNGVRSCVRFCAGRRARARARPLADAILGRCVGLEVGGAWVVVIEVTGVSCWVGSGDSVWGFSSGSTGAFVQDLKEVTYQ